jgi:hypothetical protein
MVGEMSHQQIADHLTPIEDTVSLNSGIPSSISCHSVEQENSNTTGIIYIYSIIPELKKQEFSAFEDKLALVPPIRYYINNMRRIFFN